MLQGTGSDVGKSLLLTGMARAFARRGLKVRPFKPQNMSNNAAVAADGGEIGRAQALQARACGVEPMTDMNPVLLKPQSESGAQIVLDGRVWGNASAGEYRRLAPSLLPSVLAALIAQLVGTCALLSDSERALLAGYIVNKFRGEIRLFEGGLAALAERTGLCSFGTVPYFPAVSLLPAEDSLALRAPTINPLPPPTDEGRTPVRIAVPMLPRIANFDDLDPLRGEPGVDLVMVRPGRPLPRDASLVILPGSKATLADLDFLRREGWDIDILAHRRHGGYILGLCGGYQMLGRTIADPSGIEGRRAAAPGLGLLDVDTVLGVEKRLQSAAGIELATGLPVRGYEMHLGTTSGPGLKRPMLRLADRTDGAISEDGAVTGCYLHGLFASDPFRRRFLARLGAGSGDLSYEHRIEATLDALADHLERHLDLSALLAAARGPRSTPPG